MKIGLYWQTLRHLKVGQFTGRVRFKLVKPQVDRRPGPPVGKFPGPVVFLPAPVSWRGGDEFRFLNREYEVSAPADWNTPERAKLWLYNLHYFDYLRQPEMDFRTGSKWIERWIVENPPPRGNGWEPYPLSLRIVNWIKWHLSGRPLSGQALESLAVQVRCLAGRLETHLLANHYLANAKALVFAGCFFRGAEAERWLQTGSEIYCEQLPEQVLADGGHFERSAMYHSIILEDLLDLTAIKAPLELTDRARRMLAWLAAMTGPDGRISLFNDAAFGIAPEPAQLFAYAAKLGFEMPAHVAGSRSLPDTGYARLSDGKWTLICDGAPVGPDYQPGHAHADTLSFELWHRNHRLLIDSGTGQYPDGELRREQRGTAGHNTVVVDGRNSSEVWGAHRVARRAAVTAYRLDERCFAAAHNGYAPVIHHREWTLTDERKVRVADRLDGRGTHRLEAFWHFAPECRLVERGNAVAVFSGDRQFLLTVPEGWTVELGSGRFSPEFGIVCEHPVVCFRRTAELPQKLIVEIGEVN